LRRRDSRSASDSRAFSQVFARQWRTRHGRQKAGIAGLCELGDGRGLPFLAMSGILGPVNSKPDKVIVAPSDSPSSFSDDPDRRVVAGRRRFLRGVLWGIPALACVAPVRAFAESLEERNIQLFNTHTGEELRACFYRAGTYCSDALSSLTHLLRDFRNGQQAPIDPGVFDILHEVAVAADREPRFEVISGYRSPATNTLLNERSSGVARRSLHMEGRAIDVRLQGYGTAKLRDVALALQRGGVGYYAKSDFVHLDTGRVRTWAG
jgi:uncharacterized protein YcbK (DUF882 family)